MYSFKFCYVFILVYMSYLRLKYEVKIPYKSFCMHVWSDYLRDNLTFFGGKVDYYEGIVSSRLIQLMLSSLYVVILKERFPRYPKALKIQQYIKIPLEVPKRNPFNYLSKRSRELIQVFGTVQRIRKHHLALFTATDDIARFMLEKVLKLITMYFFLYSFPSVAKQPTGA